MDSDQRIVPMPVIRRWYRKFGGRLFIVQTDTISGIPYSVLRQPPLPLTFALIWTFNSDGTSLLVAPYALPSPVIRISEPGMLVLC